MPNWYDNVDWNVCSLLAICLATPFGKSNGTQAGLAVCFSPAPPDAGCVQRSGGPRTKSNRLDRRRRPRGPGVSTEERVFRTVHRDNCIKSHFRIRVILRAQSDRGALDDRLRDLPLRRRRHGGRAYVCMYVYIYIYIYI